MEIASLGHSSFKISNKTTTVITDPFDQAKVGSKFPKLDKANIVTISHSHEDHDFKSLIPEGAFFAESAGEFEVGGVMIHGISTFHDETNGSERGRNVVFTITIDDVSICHLGDLGHKLTDAQVQEIGQVDILMIPVGGFYTISSHTASEVAVQLEPRIIIPMHYNRPGLDQKIFGQLEGLEKFFKEIGAESVVPQSKLVTSVDKLPETTTVVVLE